MLSLSIDSPFDSPYVNPVNPSHLALLQNDFAGGGGFLFVQCPFVNTTS
jgi:hypothetical protein